MSLVKLLLSLLAVLSVRPALAAPVVQRSCAGSSLCAEAAPTQAGADHAAMPTVVAPVPLVLPAAPSHLIARPEGFETKARLPKKAHAHLSSGTSPPAPF